MAFTWHVLNPAGFRHGSACSRARRVAGRECHSCIVSGRGKLNTSRERGFGSRVLVNRVSTPVLSYTNGRGSELLSHFSLAEA